MISAELRSRVAAWIADDPDERDRVELTLLLEAATGGSATGKKAAEGDEDAATELADRFSRRLEFGTAGLRGAVAAGPNRMNRAVVRGASAALAGWLWQHYRSGVSPAPAGSSPAPSDSSPAPAGSSPAPSGASPAPASVVIGCDARHRSEEFAAEAARVLAGAGIQVLLLPPRQPTPLLAFAVRHLGAAAGIMITASHNPRQDNGYKLYLSDGAQIVPPVDTEIEAGIRSLSSLAAVPAAGPDSPLIVQLGDEMARSYLDAVCAVSPAPPGAAWLRFTYTALHGVAAGLALRAFEQAGFTEPDVVEAQREPDPDFPTVAAPNPEEPGALDLALAMARRSAADLVIASDPDGDRLAVAVADPDAAGGWRTLTGDQVGALLGAYLLGCLPGLAPPARTVLPGTGPAAGPGGTGPTGPAGEPLVVTTIVSSTLLSRIAAAAGARYAQTLTGFKWIVRAGELAGGPRFAFGYEEALGYAVTDVVRDKDGIGAALAVLGLAARARARGQSLLDVYDGLEAAHGVHLTARLTVASRVPGVMTARLRGAAPTFLGGLAVSSVTDFAGGSRDLPAADVLSYRVGRDRVVIRPSGTEPKVKAYLEVVEPAGAGAGQLAQARRAAAARLTELSAAVSDLLAR
ncbi:MAG: phospho-sugar mutase [Streptosporangiaceae bacterium]